LQRVLRRNKGGLSRRQCETENLFQGKDEGGAAKGLKKSAPSEDQREYLFRASVLLGTGAFLYSKAAVALQVRAVGGDFEKVQVDERSAQI
jgi:hypothetical protein